jgi:vitamin B12 transporter
MNKLILTTLALSLLPNVLFATTDLEPVVVSTSKTEQTLKNTTANIVVITADELKLKNYRTALDALRNIAGLSFTQNGGIGTSSSLLMRGFDMKRLLILVDGIRLNDPAGLSGAELNHIMLDNVERIEVLKGAQSGIWGAEASAGVINIITKGVQKGLHATLQGESGSFQTHKLSTNISYANDTFETSVYASQTESESFSAKTVDNIPLDTLEKDTYKNKTFGINLAYNITNTDKIALSLRQYEARLEYDGFDANQTKAANDNASYSQTTNQLTSLIYTHENSKLYYNQSKFNRFFAPSNHFDGRTIEAGLEQHINYGNSDNLSIGLTKRHDEVLNTTNKRYEINSLFISNQNVVSNGIILNETLRHDSHNEFDNVTTYRIGFKQAVTQDVSYSLNLATGYNAPTLNQMFGQFGANEDLLPESTSAIDIKIDVYGLGMTYYHNTITNLIDYIITDYTTFAGGYDNISGASILKGYEFDYIAPIEVLDSQLSFNYTILDALDADGKRLARRPKDTLNVNLEYFPADNIFVALNANYVGERYDGKDEQGEQTGKYTLFGATTSYEVTEAMNIYLKLENLGDKEYEVVDGFSVNERSFYMGFSTTY